MTKWLSHRMVERGIIKEEEQELYQFGIRNGMILLLNVVTALVIGLVPVYTQAVFYKTSLAWLLAVLLVSAGIIFLLSPMHSKNRKLDKEEQKHFGRKARLIAALELAVLGILWHAGQIPYAYAVYTGIFITALFMLVGKAQLWIQSHTENG